MRNLHITLLLFSIPIIAQRNDTAPTITVESGSLQGRTIQLPDGRASVDQFLGIPFAQPPIDDLRFTPPREVEAWDGVLDATERRNACMQYLGPEGPGRVRGELLFRVPPDAPMSEDCLYLDVYVPQGGESNKSVLFWIHGGGGVMGSASWPDYDGTHFAANQDIIVVAINYRLNGEQLSKFQNRPY